LARYALILETVATSRAGMSLTEIMRATGLSIGTTHRLLKTLVEVGYLTDQDGARSYRLGPRLIRLFHLAHSPSSVALIVQPVLQDLVARFGETAFIAKLDGIEVESLAFVTPANYRQSHVQPGRVMPINAAASAKAIFAFQPEPIVARALAAPLRKYTERTIVDPIKLRHNFDLVRSQGYAVCEDELDPGVLSYACPIHLPEVGVRYSVGIVALSQRLAQFKEADMIGALKNAAATTSIRLQSELKSEAREPASTE
jgi:DNA-binding IclR family transcriptional regulator